MGLWEQLSRPFGTGASPRRTRSGVFVPLATREEALAGRERERRGALGLVGFAFCAVLALVCAVVMDYGLLPPNLRAGQKAPADIRARVDFEFESPRLLEARRAEKSQTALAVYRPVAGWEQDLLRDLKRFCEIVERAGSAAVAQAEAGINNPSDVKLVEALWEYRERHRPLSLGADFLPPIEAALRGLAGNGIVDTAGYEAIWKKPGEKALMRLDPNGQTAIVPLQQLRHVDKALDDFKFNFPQMAHYPGNLQSGLLSYLGDRLKPSLTPDETQTALERARQRETVTSAPQLFSQGTVLVTEDSIVDAEALRLLDVEAQAWRQSQGLALRAARLAGLFLVSAALIGLVVLCLRRLGGAPFKRRRPLLMLALTGVAVLIVSRALLLEGLPGQLAPVALAATCASLAFSPGAALLTALALSLLVGCAAEGNLPLAASLLVGAVVSAIPANRLQHRWDLLRYGILGGLSQALTAAGVAQLGLGGIGFGSHPLGLMPAWHSYPLWADAGWAYLNCFACSLVVLGALPLIESAYGIVTDIRLMELADQNQPALRRLMLETPGTWAHTLQLATLCEPAAEAIGANARLVRTGVYYHDLGKTLKPEYFVENNAAAAEFHQRLSPSVSALIIVSHVKDGVELAREYGLPQQIRNFIPEHHGTCLVEYFYHLARQRAGDTEEGRALTQESFFRYPGPKPQSRETAIVMLADTIEAASRTLESPSATRLRAFIHDLVMKKLLDGQLDECDLTFRELTVVEDVFVRVLISRFHTRVRYPGQAPETAGKPSPAEAAQPAAGPAGTAAQVKAGE